MENLDNRFLQGLLEGVQNEINWIFDTIEYVFKSMGFKSGFWGGDVFEMKWYGMPRKSCMNLILQCALFINWREKFLCFNPDNICLRFKAAILQNDSLGFVSNWIRIYEIVKYKQRRYSNYSEIFHWLLCGPWIKIQALQLILFLRPSTNLSV